jgi:ubiquitin-protein ligase
LTLINHPNINLLGDVDLKILNDGWTAVLGIDTVIQSLISLFKLPNPFKSLNF